ncbi:PREDICTED: carboxy-terminal domain RNA polymerase II polypeptide A small phosphatase 1-like [Fragaria vesca subsp. vesca]|uniref:carboxy-terminal domain RNA polymerase II polypeptide A small phosphatase 1-like n=1 Tax=Fragaria vesca subsp. vesca TaxID=101020 RepID=UPI0002C2E06D|nr:PREDICTED: carboxy-terminal domain RNA polymerase II polypeptide A small phosphatase 1-like [Fragaria vesca subsp. vesca]
MVSKFMKKSPSKSIATKRRHHRRSSAKKAATAASTAVLSSLITCQRRLIKLFNKLARVGTPNRHKGFKILKKTAAHDPTRPEPTAPVRRELFLAGGPLPPQESPEKKTIVLDLDETMIHSQAGAPPENYDFVVRPRIDGMVLDFYVLKRPGVDEMLEKLGEKYEVVVFTAGLREYASLVLDRLDRKRVISHRLFRDSCKEVDGKFVKDLSGLGRDLRRVVIVDDNPNSYSLQPENGVPVRPFLDDMADRELGKLVEFFEGEQCEDMRDAVKDYVAAAGDCGTENGNEFETLQT